MLHNTIYRKFVITYKNIHQYIFILSVTLNFYEKEQVKRKLMKYNQN